VLEIILALTVNPVIYQDFGETTRVGFYLTVGHELYICYAQTHLMTTEIGAMGYSFHGITLDGMGLASPEELAFYPMAVPQECTSRSIGAIPVG